MIWLPGLYQGKTRETPWCNLERASLPIEEMTARYNNRKSPHNYAPFFGLNQLENISAFICKKGQQGRGQPLQRLFLSSSHYVIFPAKELIVNFFILFKTSLAALIPERITIGMPPPGKVQWPA
jgi:hypothetical protein